MSSVPIEPEPLTFPPARSIQSVIAPMGVPWRVLINNWDPRDGELDLNQTRVHIAVMRFPAFNTAQGQHRPKPPLTLQASAPP
jgi:chromosome partitioning protein